jgi:hypothetical protein
VGDARGRDAAAVSHWCAVQDLAANSFGLVDKQHRAFRPEILARGGADAAAVHIPSRIIITVPDIIQRF